MKKNNAGYVITDYICLNGECFVLGYDPTLTVPYVIWNSDSNMESFDHERYFQDRDAALRNLLVRATKNISIFGCSVGKSLLSNQDILDLKKDIEETPLIIGEGSITAGTSKNPRGAIIKISPEYKMLLDDLMTKTRAQIQDQYGPVSNNIEFHFAPQYNIGICLRLKPEESRTPTIEVDLINKTGTVHTVSMTERQQITGTYQINTKCYPDLSASCHGQPIVIELKEDQQLRRIGNRFLFHTTSKDKYYSNHEGEICTVTRGLNHKEIDFLRHGLMWEAEFPNGDAFYVFDDELIIPGNAACNREGGSN